MAEPCVMTNPLEPTRPRAGTAYRCNSSLLCADQERRGDESAIDLGERQDDPSRRSLTAFGRRTTLLPSLGPRLGTSACARVIGTSHQSFREDRHDGLAPQEAKLLTAAPWGPRP